MATLGLGWEACGWPTTVEEACVGAVPLRTAGRAGNGAGADGGIAWAAAEEAILLYAFGTLAG